MSDKTELVKHAKQNRVTGVVEDVGYPILATDAANKKYVDDQVGGMGGAISLNDLTDVDVSGVALDRILKYNGAAWVAAVEGGGGGGGGAINDLDDVTVAAPQNGDILKYNGVNFVNVPDPAAGPVPDPLDLNVLKVNNGFIQNGTTTFTNSDIVFPGKGTKILAVVNDQLRFLESGIYVQLPDTGVTSISAIFAGWAGLLPSSADVPFEIMCTFEILVNGSNQSMITRLRKEFDTVCEAQCNSGPLNNFGYQAYCLRTIYQGPPPNSWSLYTVPAPTTALATCNIRNVRFTVRPIVL